MTNDSEDLSLLDIEGDVLQSPEGVAFRSMLGSHCPLTAVSPKHRSRGIGDLVPQGIVSFVENRDLILFGESLDSNRKVTHASQHVSKGPLHAFEKNSSTDQDRHNHQGTHGHDREVRGVLIQRGPTKSLNHSDHWVEAVKQAPLLRHRSDWIHDR